MDEMNEEKEQERAGEEVFAEAAADVDASLVVTKKRADRFYDRMRSRISDYLASRGNRAGKSADFLLFVPDIFILLWRLTTDARVAGREKILLGTAVAYYIFPLDLMPEAFVGPVGFLDDLVFGVYVLNKLLSDVDEQVLRDHWSGRGDVLDVIRRVLHAADNLVATDVLRQLKRLLK